jgi:Cu(I)/Ag(I) efflux system membrane fusion protein
MPMRKPVAITLVAAVAVVAFAAGSFVTWQAGGGGHQGAPGRKVLYWVDPMHPSYKSDKAGIAPDCGMLLEAVYADAPLPAGADAPPANAIRVAADKQQLIGVRLGRAERASSSRTSTAIGRVAVDETRAFRVAASIEGSVRDVMPVGTGSLVHKDDLLLRLTARDILTAEQSFFYGLWAVERYQKEGAEGPDQLKIAEGQVKTGADSLASYGMSDRQIEELRRTRTPTSDIELRSPATGYVLSRSVFPNQRYDKGTEFFRIADLQHVWVLAEVFASEVTALRPGTDVQLVLPYDNPREHRARVADALPAFDPASRTFRVRLETDNPGYLLRPDMVVEVRFAIDRSVALTVPADAVVDSGTRTTVFVDRGRGYFEPRVVQTGWRADDRVEILGGLAESESIVVSGRFLLDSEARMKTAAMGLDPATSEIDPVCGMSVDPGRARTAGQAMTHDGHAYYFCSTQCRELFGKNPAAYVTGRDRQERAPAATRAAAAATTPPTDRATGSSRSRPQLPTMQLEDRKEREAALKRQAPPSTSTPPADRATGSSASQPQLPTMQLEDRKEREAALTRQAGLSPSSRRLQQTWDRANAPGSQYVPKNKLLRRPAGAEGSSMVEAKPGDLEVPGIPGAEVQLDLACAVIVNKAEAKAKGLLVDYKGKSYFFSSAACKTAFEKVPEQYINR